MSSTTAKRSHPNLTLAVLETGITWLLTAYLLAASAGTLVPKTLAMAELGHDDAAITGRPAEAA